MDRRELVDDPPKGVVCQGDDVLVDSFERTPSTMSVLALELYHGEVTRVAPTEMAFPHREPGYNLLVVSQWMEPAESAANITWARETFGSLQPFTADRHYVNYLGEHDADRVRHAYGPNWERLVELKGRYDPASLFRLNHNIQPA